MTEFLQSCLDVYQELASDVQFKKVKTPFIHEKKVPKIDYDPENPKHHECPYCRHKWDEDKPLGDASTLDPPDESLEKRGTTKTNCGNNLNDTIICSTISKGRSTSCNKLFG